MTLAAGTRIGAYQVLAPIGAGGMGEVYRAHDMRLQRDVALKVLSAGVGSDPVRLARFEQEARATAALNHPNIVAVYDVGTHEGEPFLVSELLEGETLRDSLRTGPLPTRKALDYAVQIASGLAAAHDKGIVHRDLKPENVFITTDGRAKILDFGIAKLLAAPREIETLATSASPRTDAGVVLGTAGYMSPEQIRGGTVDYRTDIFALGAMLFEMLSGARPFAGATNADAMSAVLSRDPAELITPDGAAPPAVDRIVRRCLDKAPDQRFQSARDLAFALEAITLGTGRTHSAVTSAPHVAPRIGRRELVAWASAVLLIVAIAFLMLRPAPALSPHVPPARFTVEMPGDAIMAGGAVAVSPDGTGIAFRPGPVTGQDAIHVRRLDGDGFVKLGGTEGARGFFWSPDSRSIAFFTANRELRGVHVSTSQSRLLARMPADWALGVHGSAGSAAWGIHGDILVSSNAAPLHRLRSQMGALEPITPLDESVQELEQHSPVFLPDGRRFVYVSVRAGSPAQRVTRLRTLDAGAVQDLQAFDDLIIWAGERRVVFQRGSALFAQAISYEPFSLQGAPEQLAANVQQPRLARIPTASVSPSTLVYQTEQPTPQQFMWIARDGRAIGPVGPVGQYPSAFSLSDDGSRLIVSRREPGALNIWVMDVAKGTMNRVTTGATTDVDPRLSPDGRSVIFASLRDSNRSPFKTTLAAQAPERLFQFKGSFFALDDWSPDGAWLLYHEALEPEILALRLDQLTTQPVSVVKALTGVLDQATMSGDGRWVAYHSTESGQAEVYVVPFPATGDKWQVSVGGGAQPLWHRDGKELYYLALDGTLMAVGIKTAGDRFEAGNPVCLFRSSVTSVGLGVEQYAAAPDGTRFLFAPFTENAPALMVSVITNWSALMNQPAAPR